MAGVAPGSIPEWAPVAAPASAARNRLVSLALRPAPVTDQWRAEGPKLRGLAEALRHVTYLEAPNPQTEATAIALVLARPRKTGFAPRWSAPTGTLPGRSPPRSTAGTSRPTTARGSRWA
jgi:ATP-dependent helicase/nuclease subunit B